MEEKVGCAGPTTGIISGPVTLRLVGGISNHASLELIREPIMDLLQAVVTESPDALAAFQGWCQTHAHEVGLMAFGTAFRLKP